MSKSYILQLDDERSTLENCGGKGVSLSKLKRNNLPVPDAFVITTIAYRDFITGNGLQQKINSYLTNASLDDIDTLEEISTQIKKMFRKSAIPDAIVKDIKNAYKKMASTGEVFTAVRSSATAEDLPEFSFAGQQDTFLNIKGEASILDAIKKCWASLWTARAIGYRKRNRIDQESISIAVIVQEIIPADAAGVMFTANPSNGRKKEIVINSVFGLGESMVSGAVTPDTFTVDKQKLAIVSSEIKEKNVMTARVDGGTEEKSISTNRRGMASIDNDQAIELAKFGIRIEEIYQRPMDIEWAIHENSVFILQARPITALPMADDWEIPDPRGTYARGSLAEHIPSPVTPLFRTMGLRIANESTNKMYDEFMGTEKDKQWFVGGNMYLPINLYVYAGFRLTLKDALPLIKISFKQTGPIMKGSVKRWKEAQKQFSSIVESWESKNIDLFSPSELIESAKIVFRAAADYYTVVQTILPAVSTSEMFFQWYFNSLVKRKTDPDYTSLLFGFETQPLRAEKSLYDLAMWIKENEALSHTLIQNESTIITKNIRDRKEPHGVTNDVWCEFETRFQDFIDTFGKTAYEFDFGIPTPAENPIPQIEAIKHFIRDDAENPYIRHEKAIEERENYEKEILSRLGILRKKPFIKLLKWAQNTGAIRENALADMGLGHNFIRRVLQQVGRQFEQNGAISKYDDIFWLEEPEIEELADRFENGQPLPNFEKKVIERKREWKAALKLTPPVALPEKNFMHKLLNKGAAEKVDGKTIMKGTGTSQGKVTAIARVLKGPQDFSRMQSGDILVATTTTPAWTPLFMLASAVITDIGGPLSHGSIVAREYGIPAVMAVKDASRIILDGERITVDGGKGFVILER